METHKANNAGYAVIPMPIDLMFGLLYRNSKKVIEENKDCTNYNLTK